MRSVQRDRHDLRPEQLPRTRELMDVSVPDCLITGYEGLIDNIKLPDPDDRHELIGIRFSWAATRPWDMKEDERG